MASDEQPPPTKIQTPKSISSNDLQIEASKSYLQAEL
jgi:hypothetical protein